MLSVKGRYPSSWHALGPELKTSSVYEPASWLTYDYDVSGPHYPVFLRNPPQHVFETKKQA